VITFRFRLRVGFGIGKEARANFAPQALCVCFLHQTFCRRQASCKERTQALVLHTHLPLLAFHVRASSFSCLGLSVLSVENGFRSSWYQKLIACVSCVFRRTGGRTEVYLPLCLHNRSLYLIWIGEIDRLRQLPGNRISDCSWF
jgi:hypothetical protein